MARTRLAVGLIALLAVMSQAFVISASGPTGVAIDGPTAAEPSRTTAITIRLPRQVAAVDGRLYFDTASATAVGVAPLGKGRAFAPVDIKDGIAFGAYGLRPTGNAVVLRVVLTPTAAGRLRYRLVIDAAADSSGQRLNVGAARATLGELVVRGSSRLREAPAAGKRPQPLRAAGPTRDIVADGSISAKDLDVVRAGWELSRLNEQQCGTPEFAEADANGDGCVDIVDVQAVAAGKGERAEMGSSTQAAGDSPLLASLAGPRVSDVGTAAAPSLTFVVNSTADTPDANFGDKICADSQGRCTLRAALTEANWNSGPDRIEFNLSGSAPVRIQLSSATMPLIHDRSGGVTIDGYSQPGSRVNTASVGSNAIPGIELVGTGNSPRGNALRIVSGGNTVRGILFRSFYRAVVLDGPDARNNRFVGNWLGFTTSGSAPSYTTNVGVLIDHGASDNIIGTPALADVNVMGNMTKPIFLSGPGTNGNLMQNNFFCMAPSGMSTAECQTGIDADFGPKHNVIGGTAARERNVFGRTGLNGVELSHGWDPDGSDTTDKWQVNSNRIVGNWIGFRGDGSYSASFRSAYSNAGDNGNAINMYDGSNFNTAERNWIGTVYDGIQTMMSNSVGNIIRNNVIGQSPLGEAAPFSGWGVVLMENTRLHVVEGNVIRNAGQGGVGLTDANVRRVRISGNLVFSTSGPAIYLAPPSGGLAGANDNVQPPVVSSATTVRISGTGTPGATVEVFSASRAAGQSGLPTALLGSSVVATDGSWSVAVALSTGDRVAALQIQPNDNTSALGTNVAVTFEAPPPPPTADFSWSQPGSAPTIAFTDQSTGAPSSWSWDFGDGNGSTQQNPSHSYAGPGTYSVELRVSNAGGSDTRTRTVTVTDAPPPPPAGTVAADAFGRTLSGGWGSADTGGSYTLQGTAANFSVGGGWASMIVPNAGQTRSALLNAATERDVDISFAVRTNKPANGGNWFVYAVARRDGTSEYRPRLLLHANGSVSAHASVLVNGSESPLGSAVAIPGLQHAANAVIRFRAQVVGANPTTIRLRAWADGSPEPTTWHYSTTSTTAALQDAGSLGLRAYLSGATSNAPVTFSFDEYLVTTATPPAPPPAGVVAADAFARTSASGWGVADTGGSYGHQGPASDFSVGSGSGSVVVPSAGMTRSALLPSASARDVDITFRVRTDKTVAVGNFFVYAVARRSGTSEYRPRILLRANGTVAAQASIVVSGSESALGSAVTIAGLSHVADGWINFRAQVTGAGPTTIRVKAWADGTAEPATWHFTTTDSNASLQAEGSLGLRAYVSGNATNAPVRFGFDDFLVSAAP